MVVSGNRGQSEVGPYSRLSRPVSLLTQVGGLHIGALTVVSGAKSDDYQKFLLWTFSFIIAKKHIP